MNSTVGFFTMGSLSMDASLELIVVQKQCLPDRMRDDAFRYSEVG